MTFYTIEMVICFAMLSALIFKMTENVYMWGSTKYINKKKLLRRIENMIAQETDTIQSKTAYPSAKTSAMNRLNVLVMVKELIDTM